MTFENFELGTRVSAALQEENTGTIYHRQGIICERWLDSLEDVIQEYEKWEKKLHEKQAGRAG